MTGLSTQAPDGTAHKAAADPEGDMLLVGRSRAMESQYKAYLRTSVQAYKRTSVQVERRRRVGSQWVLQKDLCNWSHSNARHQMVAASGAS
jgi:hypothetical protein